MGPLGTFLANRKLGAMFYSFTMELLTFNFFPLLPAGLLARLFPEATRHAPSKTRDWLVPLGVGVAAVAMPRKYCAPACSMHFPLPKFRAAVPQPCCRTNKQASPTFASFRDAMFQASTGNICTARRARPTAVQAC